MNKNSFVSGALSALALFACSPDAGSPGEPAGCESCDEGEAAVSPIRYTDWFTTWQMSSLDRSIEQLTARAGTYDADAFVAMGVKRDMIRFDRGRDCEARMYSTSRETGVSMFDEFAQQLPALAEVTSYQLGDMNDIVAHSENRAVVASLWDPEAGGDEATCAYAHFYVFDGEHTAASFLFDYRTGWVEPLMPMESKYIDYPAYEDSLLVRRLQEYGGNGGSAIGTFDPESFDEQAALDYIASYDYEMGRCEDRRIETESSGVLDAFDSFSADEYLSPFAPENDWFEGAEEDHAALRAALADENNMAVISSTWKDDSTDYSEGCLYFDFYTFREDGTAWRFTVSHTD